MDEFSLMAPVCSGHTVFQQTAAAQYRDLNVLLNRVGFPQDNIFWMQNDKKIGKMIKIFGKSEVKKSIL